MRFRTSCIFGILLVLCGVSARDALAQAMLGSENCKPVPTAASVDVVAENDSALDRSVLNDFVTALGAKGLPSRMPGALRVLYRSEIQQLKDVKTKVPLVESHSTSWQGREVFVHLWRSNEDSVLGGKRGERPHQNYATYLRLVVEVSDNRDGSCIWRGRAISRLEGWRKADLMKRLIPPLIDRFGQTVERVDIVLE